MTRGCVLSFGLCSQLTYPLSPSRIRLLMPASADSLRAAACAVERRRRLEDSEVVTSISGLLRRNEHLELRALHIFNDLLQVVHLLKLNLLQIRIADLGEARQSRLCFLKSLLVLLHLDEKRSDRGTRHALVLLLS